MAAFEAALDLGAGIECDLRLTADDRLVVFHDEDARRLCASPLRIGRSKWKDLAGLRVGGHPIPTLETLLGLVGGRVPLLLELKCDRDRRRWAPALSCALAGYRGRFGLMSFDPRLCRILRGEMPGVRRGLLLQDRLRTVERHLAMGIAQPHFIGAEVPALGKRWVEAARRSMPVYGWTVRTAAERAQAQVQADALIWEGDGRPRS
ncbi:MAG: glycerophosphodiester phosphodiesterase family protein [Sphingomonas sp.]